jgi:hypothetical protein
MSQNAEAFKIGGDIMFRAADFPMADELAERMKRTIPPQILGEGEPPEVQADQGAGPAADPGHAGDETHDLDTYKAETQRMQAVGAIDPEALKPIVRQLVSEAMGTPIVPLMAAHAVAEQHYMPADPSMQPDQGAMPQ